MHSLYHLLLWKRGAVKCSVSSLCAAAVPGPMSHRPFTSRRSAGRQPCLPTAHQTPWLEEAPGLQLGPTLARADAAEQIHGLAWFWALGGDWCWLLAGKL